MINPISKGSFSLKWLSITPLNNQKKQPGAFWVIFIPPKQPKRPGALFSWLSAVALGKITVAIASDEMRIGGSCGWTPSACG